jgi:hypothetical protein
MGLVADATLAAEARPGRSAISTSRGLGCDSRSSIMQTYRAYLQDAAGTITWASWIEAPSLSEARRIADAACVGQAPTVDVWCATRGHAGQGVLEAV